MDCKIVFASFVEIMKKKSFPGIIKYYFGIVINIEFVPSFLICFRILCAFKNSLLLIPPKEPLSTVFMCTVKSSFLNVKLYMNLLFFLFHLRANHYVNYSSVISQLAILTCFKTDSDFSETTKEPFLDNEKSSVSDPVIFIQ